MTFIIIIIIEAQFFSFWITRIDSFPNEFLKNKSLWDLILPDFQNPYRHIFDHQTGYPPEHDLSTQSSLIEQKLKQWTLHIKNLANSWQIYKWTLIWLCSIQLSTWWHANLSRQKSHSISVQYEHENINRLKKDYKNGVSSSLFACRFSKIYFGVSKSVFS